jgi:hypothetical protein
LGEDVNGEPKAELETSAGRGRVAEDVVALRFRRAAGGDWITTCLGVTLCGVEAVEMLDAEVDVEWPSEREEAEPDTDGGARLWGTIICQSGSSNLGLMGNGAGS